MSNTEDRRVRMTKKILKDALIEIMHTKPLYEISIKKICETADVNRSTFYHHYQSPVELYDDIINDIAADFNAIIEKNRDKSNDRKVITAEMLSYIEEKRELFLVILSDKGNISIGERLSTIVSRFLGADNNSVLATYCAQFISAGVANILWLWLNNENRLSPDEVADLLVNIITHGVKRAIMFSDK